MQELGYIAFFLLVWFVIPYVLGSWLFKRLKKKWSWLGGKKAGHKILAFGVLLVCALAGWLVEMLILTGIKLVL